MTISTTTNRTSTVGDGVVTAFSFPYLFFNDDDLTVILVTTASGAEVTQTITTHYTVAGAGVTAGGTVTMVTPPASTETLVIVREEQFTQGLDLVENDPFPSDLVEQQLDTLTMLAQQLNDGGNRTVRLASGDTTGADTTLPLPVADAFIKWDATGLALESTTTSAGQTLGGDGTVSLPFYSFSADPNSGLYRIGADNVAMSLGGSKVADFTTAGLAVTGVVTSSGNMTIGGVALLASGSAAAPAYTFTGDTDTGIYRSGGNVLDFATAGTRQVSIDGNGDFVLRSGNIILADFGAAATPGYAFNGDPDMGLYRIGADNLGVTLGGTLRFDFSTGQLSAATAGAAALMNEAASDTNPSLVPDRSDLSTGIGGGSTTVSFVVNGANILKADANTLTASQDFGFNQANPEIKGGDTDGALFISPDTANNQGGNLVLYGNTHATKAQDIEFRADTTVVAHWDESANTWALTGEVTATGFTGTLDGVLGGGTPAAATVTSLTGTLPSSVSTTGSGDIVLTGVATHATYGGSIIRAQSTRTANSGFNAFEFLSNGGAAQTFVVKGDGSIAVGSITSGFGNIDNGSSTLDTGAATVTSLTFSGTNPDILGGDTDGRLVIGPSTTNALGGQVHLYGDTHSTKAGDIDFYSDANLRGSWDESTATWDFNNIDGTVIGANTATSASFTTGTFSGVLSVDDVTDSTSGTTGSIHTDGGLGVAKDIALEKTLNFPSDDTYPGANLHYIYRDATNGLAFMGQGSSRAITFLVPNSGAISLWQTTDSAQWNSAGIFSVDDTTDSTSGTTGSIHTDGGIGVAKDLVVGVKAGIGGANTASTTLHVVGGHQRFDNSYGVQWGGTNVRITGADSTGLDFYTNNALSMDIDQANQVGIGAAASAAKLHVTQTAAADATVKFETQGAGNAVNLNFIANNQAGANYNNITSFYGSTATWRIGSQGTADNFAIAVGSGYTVAQRIDASGNVSFGAAVEAAGTVSMADANGAGIVNESLSTTNPVFLPHKTSTSTGIGGGINIISLINAGAETMHLAADGSVTTPLQPSFLAHLTSGAPNISGNGTVYNITGWTEEHDIGADFVASTGIFTAPVAGIYQFFAQIALSGLTTEAANAINLRLVTTGHTIYDVETMHDTSQQSDPICMKVSLCIQMAASDTAKLQYVGTGESAGDIQDLQAGADFRTMFSGRLAG